MTSRELRLELSFKYPAQVSHYPDDSDKLRVELLNLNGIFKSIKTGLALLNLETRELDWKLVLTIPPQKVEKKEIKSNVAVGAFVKATVAGFLLAIVVSQGVNHFWGMISA